MNDFKKHFENLSEKIKCYFVGTSANSGKKEITLKKWFNLGGVLLLLIAAFFVMLLFIASNNKPKEGSDKDGLNKDSNLAEKHKKIELGTDATKADVKWQNFLEESIENESKTRAEQLDLLKNNVTKLQKESKEEVNLELEELKSRLAYALNEIDRLNSDNQNIRLDIASLAPEQSGSLPLELGITAVNTKSAVEPPVSSFNYIPATGYVSGHLLGGIVVSTSVNSASEPIPVIIKLTSRGNLPKDFAVDIKQCRLLASAYGDISSERAIIRAEELVCENKDDGIIISTKVSGVIYGDDGANGIRGSVVSMSDKHLKNAVVGGVLSGFAGTAKGQSGLEITPLGGVSTKKKGMKDMASDGLLSGTSSAAEKLADYHIRLAENISPVILVPGGTKVDVVFTKSVEIGAGDTHAAINAERTGQ